MIGKEYKVLDHGYVKVINYYGSDEEIIEAARMSTDGAFRGWDDHECADCGGKGCDKCNGKGIIKGDKNLLNYLYKNFHHTPFEMGDLVIELQLPIFVVREWHRHRNQSFNELSGRFVKMPDLHYLPTPKRMQKQSASNKQGSDGLLDRNLADGIIDIMDREQSKIYSNYSEYIDEHGLSREIARINTPVSRYTRMRAKANLRNWLAFLNLRMRPDAQQEIREYAYVVADIIKQIWPRSYELFEEYDLFGLRFSRTQVKKMINILTPEQVKELGIKWSEFKL